MNEKQHAQHKLYIETFGCQMNLSDTQIVQSIMQDAGYLLASSLDDADIILLNTCSVRDNAEEKIHNRIETLFHLLKKRKNKNILGVIGCMAERLQNNLLSSNQIVSIVVGPDEYRKLPELVKFAFDDEKNIAVNLNSVETYNDIIPLRTDEISAWLAIMRGCDNFCSYCVVPYTRGRERSRPFETIIKEVAQLNENGFKEITLLGQNVNSYSYSGDNSYNNSENNSPKKFPLLLEEVAKVAPNMRIRFLTSHPMDLSLELVEVIAKYENICNYIHLPVQSGSNRILELMNRRYTVEHYLGLIKLIKQHIPTCAISTDIIAGYPSETMDDHNATLELMREVRYSNAFMFRYSPREGTKAFSEKDDVPEAEKIRRLNEIIALQNQISLEENEKDIGGAFEILVENPSKKNPNEWQGKTKTAKSVIFDNSESKYKSGDILNVKITRATSATLFGIRV
jgi:tRNA-2-methylthio-N6-dimethylallyladenosine synthase